MIKNKKTTNYRLTVIKKFQNNLQKQMNALLDPDPHKQKLSNAIKNIETVIKEAESSFQNGTEPWHHSTLHNMFKSIDNLQPKLTRMGYAAQTVGWWKPTQLNIPQVFYNLSAELKQREKGVKLNNTTALPNNTNASNWRYAFSNKNMRPPNKK